MTTDIFRLDDNVPRIYVEESRDFQMLCRLFTYGLNAPKYEAETLHYLNSGTLTNDRLLPNLCEKTGFVDGEKVKGEYLRFITQNFGRLVRDKGAESGIVHSVYLYMIMYNLATSCVVNIDKKEYCVKIGIRSAVKDIDILYTILKYIVPTGWIIEVYFYAQLDVWQGYSYKDTFINMVRKASAMNALYIIDTTTGDDIRGPEDSLPFDPTDPVGFDTQTGKWANEKFNGIGYEKFSGKYNITSTTAPNIWKNTNHITKYTGSVAVNAMDDTMIESFIDNPGGLAQYTPNQYGVEYWDAKGYFRYNNERYKRKDNNGRRNSNS